MKKKIAWVVIQVALLWKPAGWWIVVHRVDERGGELDKTERKWLPLFRWAVNNAEIHAMYFWELKSWFNRPAE